MTHTNAEIAAFIDANKTRAGWWKKIGVCTKCESDLRFTFGHIKKETRNGPAWVCDSCGAEFGKADLESDPWTGDHIKTVPSTDGITLLFYNECDDETNGCGMPDFATDDIACFKELRPVLLAMKLCIVEDGEINYTSVIDSDSNEVVRHDGECTYAAALTAAFSWAMDNQPEALRRACEEVDHA